MGSNGALEASRTSTASSMSSMAASPAHIASASHPVASHPHIKTTSSERMNNYMSEDDNPDEPLFVNDPTINNTNQGSDGGLGGGHRTGSRTGNGLLEPSSVGDGSGQGGVGDRGGHNGGQSGDDAATIALTKQDFLVSFLVDARGGSMKGCRFSGVKVGIVIFFLLLQYFTMIVLSIQMQ